MPGTMPSGRVQRRIKNVIEGLDGATIVDIECIVQEGYVLEGVRQNLAAELVRLSTAILGDSPNDVDVEFIEIPKGFGFRGGMPSTTSG